MIPENQNKMTQISPAVYQKLVVCSGYKKKRKKKKKKKKPASSALKKEAISSKLLTGTKRMFVNCFAPYVQSRS